MMIAGSYFTALLVFVISWSRSRQLDRQFCQSSLGMQSFHIKDESLSASSSLDGSNFTAANARVRLELGGGAWCPKNQISRGVYEYLEVDLGSLHVVTVVETQGRFGHGEGQEVTEQYRLEYQRVQGETWRRYKDYKNNEIFPGNTNTYVPEIRDVVPAIVASRVRFVPVSDSDHPRKVCLRVELYGCPWTEGILWYSIPQGEKRRDLDFSDHSYDGEKRLIVPDGPGAFDAPNNYQLIGGLGQLTDGVGGQKNFRLDLSKTGRKGHEWIGWKNDSFQTGSVELLFAFESLRNFSSLSIFCNNMFSRDVMCFSKAHVIIYRSDYRDSKGLKTVNFNCARDEEFETARNITIDLENSVGKFVKVVLYFDSKWMLISEVYFSSVPAELRENDNTGMEGDHLNHLQTQSNIVSDSRILPTTPSSPGNNKINNRNRNETSHGSSPYDNNNNNNNNIPTQEKQKNETSSSGAAGAGGSAASAAGGSAAAGGSSNDKTYVLSSRNELDLNIILLSVLGLLVAIFLTFFLVFCFFKGRRYCCHSSSEHCFLAPNHHHHHHRPHPSKSPSILMSSTIPSNSFFLPLSKSDTSSATFRQSYSFPAAMNADDQNSGSTVVDPLVFSPFNISPITAEETISRPSSSSVSYPLTFLDSLPGRGKVRTSNCLNGGFSTSTQPLLPPVYSASSMGFPYVPMQDGHTCAPLTSSNSVPLAYHSLSPPEVSRDCLKYVATIGNGKFGQVYLCEMQPTGTFNQYSTLNSISSWKAHINPTLVAVKVLLAHTDETSRTKFENELHIMSRVKDGNIANLLGVCTRDLPNCLVFEYLRYGDLKKFLQKRCLPENIIDRVDTSTPSPIPGQSPTSEEGAANSQKSDVLSTGCLLYMSCQIGQGMKHLESLGLVHRDLACRNCLVGNNFHVKVSDMGTSHTIYESDYFSLPSSELLLPVRWMAWEAVLLGKFTTKTDVWSFGMTLWEMLHFSHMTPFCDMNEEQVLENCENFRCENGSEVIPPKPAVCPRELYDLMCHCWSREKDARPTFHEIAMFLQQKTSGYNPQDDRHLLDDESLISE